MWSLVYAEMACTQLLTCNTGIPPIYRQLMSQHLLQSGKKLLEGSSDSPDHQTSLLDIHRQRCVRHALTWIVYAAHLDGDPLVM